MVYHQIVKVNGIIEVTGDCYADCILADGRQITILKAEADFCQMLARMPLTDKQRQEVCRGAEAYAAARVREESND